MGHCLILGQTESGKTSLARALCENYKNQGVETIVLDPMHDPRWQCSFKTAEPDLFFQVYNDSTRCAAFFDEAGDLCKDYPTEMIRTATKGRHRGHRNHYIAQRATLINRTIRDQCTELFLFNSALEDCKIHAAEWNAPDIRDHGPFLAQGEYFYKQRLGILQRGKLF